MRIVTRGEQGGEGNTVGGGGYRGERRVKGTKKERLGGLERRRGGGEDWGRSGGGSRVGRGGGR